MNSIDCSTMYGTRLVFVKRGSQDRGKTTKTLKKCKALCKKWADCEAISYNKSLRRNNCIMHKVTLHVSFIYV